MSVLYLEKYSDHRKKYIIETTKEAPFSVKRIKKKESDAHLQGFCSFRKPGLGLVRRVPVAVYTDGQFLYMNIAERKYNLSEAGVTAKRKWRFPLIKEFAIKKGSSILEKFLYWDTASGDYSDDGDIFSYAETVTSDRHSKKDFLCILKASMKYKRRIKP